MSIRLTRLSASLVVMAFGLGLRAVADASPALRPNVLFIITDQQSADAMSCRMGREFIHTPVMDGLAAEGVLFTRAYSSNPLCMPWRASVFSGRYPHQTGVTTNERPDAWDPEASLSMGRHFREAGYEAAYSGKWHLCYSAGKPAEHGFEILPSKAPGGYDAGVASGAVGFLRRPHERPFLLVASFLNPHNICQWARRAAGREQELNCGEIGEPPEVDLLPPAPANLEPQKGEPDALAFLRRSYQVDEGLFPVNHFTAEDWRRQRWGYYRMVELVDTEIGKVMAVLREAGLEQDTWVIFTADHGECAGAHRWNQKTVLYEESVRIPLIIARKGTTRAGTTDKLVNTGVDLLPTMLDFAGINLPTRLPGRSLAPLARGEAISDWREYVVVQNHMVQGGEVDGFKPTLQGRMVRTERFKYCVYDRGQQRESLVNLQEDPGEMINLARDPAHRDELLRHRNLLTRFGLEQDDPLAAELLADDVKALPFPR